MAFNPINFAQLSPQRTAMADLFGNILEGYKMGQEPAKLAEERKQAELMNAFKQMQLEQQPQLFASQMEGNSLANQQARMNLQNMPMEQKLKMALLQQKINEIQNKRPPMTPEEQIAFERDKARAIAEGKGMGGSGLGQDMTTATRSDIEKQITGIDTFLPMLESLIKFNDPYGFNPNPNRRKLLSSKIKAAADKYVNAFKLPGTDKSIDIGLDILTKGYSETSGGWHSRLEGLKEEVEETKKILMSKLGTTNSSSTTRKTFKNKAEFDKFMMSLSPEQRQAYISSHGGG